MFQKGEGIHITMEVPSLIVAKIIRYLKTLKAIVEVNNMINTNKSSMDVKDIDNIIGFLEEMMKSPPAKFEEFDH